MHDQIALCIKLIYNVMYLFSDYVDFIMVTLPFWDNGVQTKNTNDTTVKDNLVQYKISAQS